MRNKVSVSRIKLRHVIFSCLRKYASGIPPQTREQVGSYSGKHFVSYRRGSESITGVKHVNL